jgi:hypothetical protein
VDVFFVLSGYLITTILLRDYRTFGRIRFSTFLRATRAPTHARVVRHSDSELGALGPDPESGTVHACGNRQPLLLCELVHLPPWFRLRGRAGSHVVVVDRGTVLHCLAGPAARAAGVLSHIATAGDNRVRSGGGSRDRPSAALLLQLDARFLLLHPRPHRRNPDRRRLRAGYFRTRERRGVLGGPARDINGVGMRNHTGDSDCVPHPGIGFSLRRRIILRRFIRGRSDAAPRTLEERADDTIAVESSRRRDRQAFLWHLPLPLPNLYRTRGSRHAGHMVENRRG